MSTETPTGKGQPTPSRREQEAARKRPLVPADRRQAAKDSRARMAEEREKARIGLMSGDEKYLPARDKGPQRRYIRDYVDARWSVGEVLLPILFVAVLATFLPTSLIEYVYLGMWAFIVLVAIDCFALTVTLMRRLRAKFGTDKVEKGARFYAVMRALQFRPLRAPKPKVKHGQWPA